MTFVLMKEMFQEDKFALYYPIIILSAMRYNTGCTHVRINECSSVILSQCPSHHPASHHTFSQTATEMEEV